MSFGTVLNWSDFLSFILCTGIKIYVLLSMLTLSCRECLASILAIILLSLEVEALDVVLKSGLS